ncbi:MAG TPA: UDP-N-acetylglucosamine 2-epimerase (hydrolyzing), partial [Planctomycetes bacterium]|nr:UDP-N-acetylglucosamine 2-epimerase (hydrolyzing) [Planctomycetota bacterium]
MGSGKSRSTVQIRHRAKSAPGPTTFRITSWSEEKFSRTARRSGSAGRSGSGSSSSSLESTPDSGCTTSISRLRSSWREAAVRTIAVVTTSRADYGHLIWPLRDLRASEGIDLRIIALGAQMSPEFGETYRELERDGFEIDHKIECLLSSDTDVGMAKTIGLATLSLADILGEMRPDILLLIADRYEMLAPAAVALSLRIPIAHIEGGEVSEGAIDQAVRDSLTKMSHVHFVPTETSRQRVIEMGEEPWRVHRTGAPSIDHLKRSERPGKREVEEAIGLSLEVPPVVVAFHPVTLDIDTTTEAVPFFEAIETIDRPIVFCFPNPDSGSHGILERAQAFCSRRDDRKLCVNLPHLTYWS